MVADINTVVAGDAVEVLSGLEPESVELVFADPPFNIGVKYDTCQDRKTRDEYLGWTDQWLVAAVRVLKVTGSICVAISTRLCGYLQVKLDALGLHHRNTIPWVYSFGPHQKRKLTPSHTPILYYTRDPKQFTFNAADIRVPSERQRLGDKRADPRGRVPGDVWHFPRVCGSFKRRVAGHPCQMPVEVLERIVRMASNPGELVLDPFAGSGSTLVAAQKLGRNFLGVDVSTAYVETARRRLAELTAAAARA